MFCLKGRGTKHKFCIHKRQWDHILVNIVFVVDVSCQNPWELKMCFFVVVASEQFRDCPLRRCYFVQVVGVVVEKVVS